MVGLKRFGQSQALGDYRTKIIESMQASLSKVGQSRRKRFEAVLAKASGLNDKELLQSIFEEGFMTSYFFTTPQEKWARRFSKGAVATLVVNLADLSERQLRNVNIGFDAFGASPWVEFDFPYETLDDALDTARFLAE